MTTRINHFDREKPFYPLVTHYFIQLFGFKELALRGVGGCAAVDDLAARVFCHLHPGSNSEQERAEVHKKVQKLAGPLELRSEYQGNHIMIDTELLAGEVFQNHKYLLSHMMRSAGSLLILAHELSKDSAWHDCGPLWEFLRHCRNAAAHGACFHLLHSAPNRPARWGRFAIDPALHGTPLFKDNTHVGMLSPGDPIRLLWDIEQAYPAMSV